MRIEQQKLDEYIRQQKLKEEREQIAIDRQHRLEDKHEAEKLIQEKLELRIMLTFLIVIIFIVITYITK